jgi:hypothetical protein
MIIAESPRMQPRRARAPREETAEMLAAVLCRDHDTLEPLISYSIPGFVGKVAAGLNFGWR